MSDSLYITYKSNIYFNIIFINKISLLDKNILINEKNYLRLIFQDLNEEIVRDIKKYERCSYENSIKRILKNHIYYILIKINHEQKRKDWDNFNSIL